MKIKSISIATIYLVFVMFLPNTLYLLNQPGIPLISARRAFIMAWIVFFAVMLIKKKSVRIELSTFPFYRSVLVFLSALGIIGVFTFTSNSESLKGYLTTMVETIFPLFMFWTAFKEKDRLCGSVKLMVYVYTLMALYGIIAHVFNANPLLELLSDENGAVRRLTYTYDDFERGGLQGRAQSFFAHAIVFGYLSAVMLVFVVGVQRSLKLFSVKKYFFICLVLIVAIFLSGSRSPLLLLVIAFLMYVAHLNVVSIVKTIALSVFAITLLVGSGVADVVLGDYAQFVTSLFQDVFSNESSLGGSSFGMRMMQLDAALNMFWESPIYGHGFAYMRTLIENDLSGDMLGGESFAFLLLVEMGLIGIAAYFILFASVYACFSKYLKSVYSKEISHLALVGIALLGGHIAFIFSTGELGVSPIFFMLLTLLLRLVYLTQAERQRRLNQVAVVK